MEQLNFIICFSYLFSLKSETMTKHSNKSKEGESKNKIRKGQNKTESRKNKKICKSSSFALFKTSLRLNSTTTTKKRVENNNKFAYRFSKNVRIHGGPGKCTRREATTHGTTSVKGQTASDPTGRQTTTRSGWRFAAGTCSTRECCQR